MFNSFIQCQDDIIPIASIETKVYIYEEGMNELGLLIYMRKESFDY